MILESKYWITSLLFGFLFLAGCFPASPEIGEVTPTAGLQPSPTQEVHLVPEAAAKEPTLISATLTSVSKLDPTNTPEVRSETQSQAMILSVKVSGEAGGYNISVTVSSADEGCSQYADWWEVVNEDEELVYRRILLHSHVDEQPFTRSGGPVPIESNEEVIVRVHMNNSGYRSQAMIGSPEQGFELIELSPGFAANLGEIQPLPGDCGF
jgi:hypothetical protein